MTAAAAAMIAILFYSPSESDEEPDSALASLSPDEAGAGKDDAGSGDRIERSRMNLDDVQGEPTNLSGSLFLNGSSLPDVGIEVFVNSPEVLSASVRSQIKSSPFFYSDRTAKVIAETGLAAHLGKTRKPVPEARCRTGDNGSFEITVTLSRTISFGLDHDFYFFPGDEAGPFSWSTEAGKEELEGFDGKLEARVGAMIQGTVVDADELPLKGVSVDLVEAAEGGGFGRFMFQRGGGSDRFQGLETTTDEQGRFNFRGVEPDREIRLRATLDGFASSQSKIFEVQPGEVVRKDLSLQEGSSISVLVLGPEGGSKGGVEVYLEKVGSGAGTERSGRGGRGMGGFGMFGSVSIAAAGKTGPDGKFVFDSLGAGHYHVKACCPGVVEARTENPLEITEEAGNVKVQLLLGQGLSIRGIVVNDLEKPVDGAVVQAVLHLDGNPFRGGRGGMERRMEVAAAPPGSRKQAVSKSDGSFLITGLSTETKYDLFAEAEQLVPAESREIDPGTVDLVLQMSRHGRIRGRVVASGANEPITRFSIRTVPTPDEEDRGGGRDANRQFGRGWPGRDQGRGAGGGRGQGDRGGESSSPVETLMRTMGEVMRQPIGPSYDLTDKEDDFESSNGSFSMKEIVPGRYRLCVSAKGYEPRLTDPFVLEKGETMDGLVIDLAPGVSISGKALSSFGPVEEAFIAVRTDREQGRDLGILLGTLKECRTGSDGAFIINSLPPGRFSLRATHQDHPSVTTDVLELVEGQSLRAVNILFPPAAKIVGFAFDETGLPLENQVVSCRSVGDERGGGDSRGGGRGGFRMERTDREGRFEVGGLRAGMYSVSISTRGGMGFRMGGRGGEENAVEVNLLEGDVAEIVLQKKPLEGVKVQGTITDGSETVGRGFLTVSPDGGRSRNGTRSGTINEDGTYEVEGVQPGLNRFTVRFMARQSFESTTLEFDVPDIHTFHLDIPLPGSRISGIVLDQITRLPLEDVRVELSEEGSGPQPEMRGRRGRWGGGRSVTTDKEGAFQFRFLTPGQYTVEARPNSRLTTSDGFRYFSSKIDGLSLEEGRSLANLQLHLGPGGGIEVIVVDENSDPVRSASITAFKEGASAGGGNNTIRGRTNEEGKAVLNGVEPGLYSLNIQARQFSQQAMGSVAVSSGRYTLERITLESGFQVSIRIVSKDGQPVEGASLTLRNAGGTPLTIPRARGGRSSGNVYDIGNLSPGQYTIEAEWNGAEGSTTFGVSSAGTIPVTLR